jgi:hypothetical protein
LKILQRSGTSKPTSVLQLLRSRKEVSDIVDRSVHASDVVARAPSIRWLKKDEAKMK